MPYHLGSIHIEPGVEGTFTFNPNIEVPPQEKMSNTNLALIFEETIQATQGESYAAMMAYLARHYPGVRLSIGDLALYIKRKQEEQ